MESQIVWCHLGHPIPLTEPATSDVSSLQPSSSGQAVAMVRTLEWADKVLRIRMPNTFVEPQLQFLGLNLTAPGFGSFAFCFPKPLAHRFSITQRWLLDW